MQQGLEVENEAGKQEFRKTVAAQQACKRRSLKHTEKEEEDGLQLPDLGKARCRGIYTQRIHDTAQVLYVQK